MKLSSAAITLSLPRSGAGQAKSTRMASRRIHRLDDAQPAKGRVALFSPRTLNPPKNSPPGQSNTRLDRIEWECPPGREGAPFPRSLIQSRSVRVIGASSYEQLFETYDSVGSFDNPRIPQFPRPPIPLGLKQQLCVARSPFGRKLSPTAYFHKPLHPSSQNPPSAIP